MIPVKVSLHGGKGGFFYIETKDKVYKSTNSGLKKLIDFSEAVKTSELSNRIFNLKCDTKKLAVKLNNLAHINAIYEKIDNSADKALEEINEMVNKYKKRVIELH